MIEAPKRYFWASAYWGKWYHLIYKGSAPDKHGNRKAVCGTCLYPAWRGDKCVEEDEACKRCSRWLEDHPDA